MSTYGDTATLLVTAGIVQPSNLLVDIMREQAHWLVTLAPLRMKNGQPILYPTSGLTRFVARGTIGHAERELPFEVDWPIEGCTFAVCCSALRLNCGLEGTAITGTGQFVPDVVFTAWAAEQSGPRQTRYAPRRTLDFAIIAAGALAPKQQVPAMACAYTLQVGRGAAAVAAGGAGVYVYHYNSSSTTPSVIRSDEWWASPVPVASVNVRVGLVQGAVGADVLVEQVARVALPPDVQQIEIFNAAAVNLQAVRAVFELDLG